MTPGELNMVLAATEAKSLDGITYLILFVVCSLAAILGTFLSSYVKRKGQNFATQEDLKSLKSQTRELTEATEKVKTEIANHSWKESKKWELKFQMYTEVLEALSSWRISIDAIRTEGVDSDGELREDADRNRLEGISSKIQSTFENLARVEALSEIALPSAHNEKIRSIKKTATEGTSAQDVHQAFSTTIQKLKELESELAHLAREELFQDKC